MANCELCGTEAPLNKADIEGIVLEVCRKCSAFGKVIQDPIIRRKEIKHEIPESNEVIVSDMPEKIRAARGQRGMTQEEFAKMINEKLSIVQKIEGGSFMPPIPMARRLEKMLKLKLVENAKQEEAVNKKTVSDEVTIGDIIKLKNG